MKEFFKKYKIDLAILLLCVLAEAVLSNLTAIGILFSGADRVDFDLNNAVLIECGENDCVENGIIKISEGTVEFNGVNTKMHSVYITLSGSTQYTPVTVSFTDGNFAYDDGFDYNSSKFNMYVNSNEENVFTIASYGEVQNLRLSFGDLTGSVRINSVSINRCPKLGFNVLRFALIYLVCVIVKYRLWMVKFNPKRHSKYIFILGAAMCAFIIYIAVVFAASSPYDSLVEEYPVNDISSADEYTQLFDAFKKGQLNLDIDYDTAKLDALNNAYDRSERNEFDARGGFWDRAYYNGKFYSYFGVAPVFTVYFPVNILTGGVPSSEFASVLLCIYAIIFITLLYNLILEKFCRKTSAVLAALGYISLLFTSGIFAVTGQGMFYYIAVLSGIGWVAAFLYFLLKAYYAEGFKTRIVFLVLTGISVVMTAASRPTLLLYALAAAVPAIFVFADKAETLKSKLWYLFSIGTPIVFGAAAIMTYNYLRFDSPFEFGFNYQLTVSIAHANTITLSMIPAAVYHYYLQQPRVFLSFPFLEMKTRSMDGYARYNYIGRCVGVLNYPLIWGVFALPFVTNNYRANKNKRFKKYFLITVTGCAVLLSFIDMCKAGAHFRYTVDILLPLGIVAIVAVFNLLTIIEGISYRHYKCAYIFAACCLVISAIFGYLMIFADPSSGIMENYPSVARLFQIILI